MTELEKASFEVREGRVIAHVRTAGEQSFNDDRYRIDPRFEAALEED